MSMGVLFALLAGFGWSITNILDKVVVAKHITSLKQLFVLVSMIHLIAGGLILFFFQEPVTIAHKLLIILAAGFWIVMFVTYFISAQIEEISRVTPLFALTPVFTSIMGALFLGEVFSLVTYFGIAIIVFGSMLIMFKSSINQMLGSRAFGYMIFSALSVAFNAIIIKHLLEYYSYWTVFAWTTFFAGLLGLIFFYKHIKSFQQTLRISGWTGAWLYALSETISSISTLIYTLAVSLWFVSLVSSVVTIQYLFVFLWAVMLSRLKPRLFSEQITKKIVAQKITAIVLIIAGIFLIA